jgi:ArsR family transcriptional regulator
VSAGELGVLEENGARKDAQDKDIDRLVALGRALSDPIRVRMLSMMADGRSCCDFSDSGVPVVEGEEGICVCEFEEHFGMGQSKVSYHMKKLKDAGLVHEERRGKWSFYTLDQEAAGQLLGEAADRLLPVPRIGAWPVAAAEVGDRARVLFLSTHNSARSQMAEALLRHLSAGRRSYTVL